MPRRAKQDREFYETPPGFTRVLLDHLHVGSIHPVYGRKILDTEHTIFEPMVGDGAIVRVLNERGLYNVLTNDLDPARDAHTHFDAAVPCSWEAHGVDEIDWTIFNPAFSVAIHAWRQAYACSRRGVAMHIRLSYEEPSVEREDNLINYPWQGRIVLPRYQYDPTAKGTDSVTCCWLIWIKGESEQWSVVAPRSTKDETF